MKSCEHQVREPGAVAGGGETRPFEQKVRQKVGHDSDQTTASQEKTAQNGVVLATSEQLELVSWMPRAKRVKIYSKYKGAIHAK